MANSLNELIPLIISRIVQFFPQQVKMARLVNSDFGSEAAERGTTIDIPKSRRKSVSDVTPGVNAPTPSDSEFDQEQIRLNKWKQTDFHLTMKEKMEIAERPGSMPVSVTDSAVSLAEYVNADIADAYKSAYLHAGTPGNTPFASDTSDIKAIRKIMNQQDLPLMDRRMTLDADAEANAVDLGAFQDVDKAGDTQAKVAGMVGHKFGFDFYFLPELPEHVTGNNPDGGNDATVDAALLGAESIAITVPNGETMAVKEGDILQIVGYSQDLVVRADASAAGTGAGGELVVSIQPALPVAINDNPIVTILGATTVAGSYAVNLAFHREAIGFANRPQALPMNARPGQFTPIMEPLTGLSLLLEHNIQHKQEAWYLSILYGWTVVRPEALIRLHG